MAMSSFENNNSFDGSNNGESEPYWQTTTTLELSLSVEDGKSNIGLADSSETNSTFVVVNSSHLLTNSTSNCSLAILNSSVACEAAQNSNDFGWTDAALVCLFCFIIAGTLIGNTLVIAAVTTTRRLRTVTNCFVMSLAVADWLVGMIVMPLKVGLFLVNNEWKFGFLLCEFWISLDILLCTASILSLCAISIDRYLAITRPLAYSRRRRSKRLALSMITCVWIAAIVITSPPIFGWYDETRNHEKTCEYNDHVGYVVYSALGSFFLPLTVMLYVYARIACVIAQRQLTIEKLHNNAVKKCCEDRGRGRDEAVTRALDSLDEHNRVERSSSSSASHTISHTQNSPSGERDSRIWSRLRLHSSSKSTEHSTKTDRLTTMENHREIVRANTLGKTYKSAGHSGRTRTGSRLCHHSVTTLSPQRSIHYSRPPASSAIMSFSDGDLTMSRDSTRIWTIEGSTNDQSSKLNGRVQNCVASAESPSPFDNGRIIESSLSEPQSRVYPSPGLLKSHNHNPAENSVGGGGGNSTGNCLQVQSIPSQRRSVKSNVSLRISSPTSTQADQNQNSAAALVNREFTSGRMASFKRETKTAQTLAAVVGGFICCWLPFFVAYVIGPFISYQIPGPLMDGLIWLGWGNSAINPFIYAFYSQDFRSAFWRLILAPFHKLQGLFRRGDRNSPTNTMRTSN